jgi:hypothetical protein
VPLSAAGLSELDASWWIQYGYGLFLPCKAASPGFLVVTAQHFGFKISKLQEINYTEIVRTVSNRRVSERCCEGDNIKCGCVWVRPNTRVR